jgi:EAL domain-containing protein (putative c-di-GMP-specific phosphodiesterase class I)
MDVDRPTSPVLVAAFNTVMTARAIHCVYQPVMDLHADKVVGYEALARGPSGTSWSTPDALVNYAERVGRLPELDWICRAAACRGALEARMPPEMPLFVNVEPASSRTQCPPDLVDVIQAALERLQIVAEVTERSVAHDPAGLLFAVEELRAYGNRIALDDVGADAHSQAMMYVLRPDVIKLDRSIIKDRHSPEAHAVINAVHAEAKRTGAVVLAEGIETAADLAAAKAVGATLGQGFLLGRPGPLPTVITRPQSALPRLLTEPLVQTTPFDVANARLSAIATGRPTLVGLSRALEDLGIQAREPALLLSTFQHARHFSVEIRERYAKAASSHVLTAAFGEQMPATPTRNVRGCALDPSDPLVGEWTVIVVGSDFARGFFARQRDPSRETFDLIMSDDRELVLEAARPLLQRLKPEPVTA